MRSQSFDSAPVTRLRMCEARCGVLTQVARRRTPCHAGDRPPLRPYQIFEVFADRLFITEIMMMLNQAVEERLLACTPDLLHFDRSEFAQ